MARRAEEDIQSILLVDDQQSSLDLYESLIQQKSEASVVTSMVPSVALKLAQKHFFNIILIDVTMNYNGTPFGGFELYKSLVGRYGDASLILYSHYVNEDLLGQFGYNFFEKGDNDIEFAEKILGHCKALRKMQSCFVAMPFDRKYDPIYHAVKKCIEQPSYRCVRVDEHAFTKSIVEKVLEEIRNAKLVVFLATDKNPNAFFECGYAVALDKEIITLTYVYSHLPFDIRDRSAVAYGDRRRTYGSDLPRN
jgi:CheY-like chemotaxis protein